MGFKIKKNSEHLGIELKKCNNYPNISNTQANINKGRMPLIIRGKECKITNGRKYDLERIEGGK